MILYTPSSIQNIYGPWAKNVKKKKKNLKNPSLRHNIWTWERTNPPFITLNPPMKQSTVDFCFANLAAFKRRPSPDQELSVTCGGPALPPLAFAPSRARVLGPGKKDHQRRKKLFMNSFYPRPLRSMKISTLTFLCALAQHPDTHFLGDTPPPSPVKLAGAVASASTNASSSRRSPCSPAAPRVD